ncbi:hypothetical protein ACFL49_00645 [Candidatus Omnitrophota bacterium]
MENGANLAQKTSIFMLLRLTNLIELKTTKRKITTRIRRNSEKALE